MGFPALCRNRDTQLSAEIAACERLRVGKQLFARSCKNHLTAMLARAGTKIEYVIGREDGFGIVLDHEQSVSQIAQSLQDFNSGDLCRVGADRLRFVEHIKCADQLRSEGSCQLNSLRLTA